MIHSPRRLVLLCTICVLLVSCSQTANAGNHDGPAFPTPTPTSTSALATASTCPLTLNLPTSCLTPAAMRTLYGMDTLIQQGFTGKGQTVIDVVSFGSPTLQQDMAVFDKTFGLPPLDLQVISPLSTPEYDPHHDKIGWAQETELDVQIIHALAPDAKVIVLTSPVAETEGTIGLPEFRQLEQYAIDNKLGNIVSQSWGASEITLQDAAGQAELQKWNALLQQGTSQHNITYFSSSGDNGATDYSDLASTRLSTVPTTSFAPDSPWVTSVGGTTVSRTGNTFHEVAWDHSGGGLSRFYQTPSYQKTLPASVQSLLNNRRGVPDVSANGDPNSGMAIYYDGTWTLGGGTSASSPVWAAVMAIANQKAGHPLGFINPALYKLAASNTYAQDFHDITEGNNSMGGVQGYSATVGWDAVTGLGTPNAQNLIPDLIAATDGTASGTAI